MTIWLHTSNAIKINNRSYFLLLNRGLSQKKKKNDAKKGLIPDKKSLIPDTLNQLGTPTTR